ncbi:MORC family CW-type zinc finger protein 3 isoform X1 [Spatholobus suberectus]|nr:MORC family CW-type zinc finger protein 3 isoform X1 [Spatholobus suberectus]
MAAIEIVDLCSDDEEEKVGSKAAITSSANKQNETKKEGQVTEHQRFQSHSTTQVSEENKTSSGLSTCRSYSGVMEQGLLHADDTGFSSSPICRNFWKAGNHDSGPGSKVSFQNVENYLHVHPLFLHSNATSHKWAFGAVAELLDNAVDEIQNGATFVL